MSMYVFSTIYRVFDSARKEINTQPVEPAAREKRGRRNVLHGLGFYVCVCGNLGQMPQRSEQQELNPNPSRTHYVLGPSE